MTISNLKATATGAVSWTNHKPYGSELVVMWRMHGNALWTSAGIDRASTSYQIPSMSAGMTYDVGLVVDPGRLNATFTVPAPPKPPVPTPTPVPVPVPTVKPQAGVSVGGNFQNEDAETQTNDLDAIAASGVSWIRLDINWAQIQGGGSNAFDWTSDAIVKGAVSRGLKVLGSVVYSPDWAGAVPNPTAYAAFVKMAVAHYAALGVHTFEIWNEPNLGGNWGGKADPAAYATMLKAAYVAAKAADSSCTVISGGLSPAPTDGTNMSPADFLAGVYAAGGAGFMDAVGHHPYCSPALPGSTDAWSAWFQMAALRVWMVANGDAGKQIWATEYGAPTGGPKGEAGIVNEAVQASMISTAFKVWGSYSWEGPLFIYQHRDAGTNASTDQDWYGLARADGSLKPAYAALQAAVK